MAAIDKTEKEFDDWFKEILTMLDSPRKIEKDYNFSRDVNNKICSECGGECCKKCGCHYSPDDFK